MQQRVKYNMIARHERRSTLGTGSGDSIIQDENEWFWNMAYLSNYKLLMWVMVRTLMYIDNVEHTRQDLHDTSSVASTTSRASQEQHWRRRSISDSSGSDVTKSTGLWFKWSVISHSSPDFSHNQWSLYWAPLSCYTHWWWGEVDLVPKVSVANLQQRTKQSFGKVFWALPGSIWWSEPLFSTSSRMVQEDAYDESGSSDSEGSIDEQDLADATLPEPQPIQIKISTLHRKYGNAALWSMLSCLFWNWCAKVDIEMVLSSWTHTINEM